MKQFIQNVKDVRVGDNIFSHCTVSAIKDNVFFITDKNVKDKDCSVLNLFFMEHFCNENLVYRDVDIADFVTYVYPPEGNIVSIWVEDKFRKDFNFYHCGNNPALLGDIVIKRHCNDVVGVEAKIPSLYIEHEDIRRLFAKTLKEITATL